MPRGLAHALLLAALSIVGLGAWLWSPWVLLAIPVLWILWLLFDMPEPHPGPVTKTSFWKR